MYSEPKRKRVHPLEEGLDYTLEELKDDDYDPKKERKLVLTRLGPAGSEGEAWEANADKVWQDPRITSLLEAASEEAKNSDVETTAPSGKGSVRPSHMQLPSTPYSLLTVDQVLRGLMPTSDGDDSAKISKDNGNPIVDEVPSSFEIAGHIAHVNLRDESLPYKFLIGKAILDKNRPKIKLVVNKIGNIENEFRTFPMEILAGDALDLETVEKLCANESQEEVQLKIGPQHQKIMQVVVKEHGCKFQLDFARVYFNSRLQGEHDRLVKHIVKDAKANGCSTQASKECIVADAMAGVGPFAVPLTSATAPHYHKTKIICHANDLNPVSYDYLQSNARLNKSFSDRLFMYNSDAREFIHKMNEEKVKADHFIMNLPQLAPEFLDAFRGWNFSENATGDSGSTDTTAKRPLIHVHCFGEKARGAEDRVRVEKQVRERCEKALGCVDCLSSEENELQIHVVRDVGPRKNMFCVSFRLPVEVADVEKLVLPNSNGKRPLNDEGGDDVSSKKSKES